MKLFKKLLTSLTAAILVASMTVVQLPVTALAADSDNNSITLDGAVTNITVNGKSYPSDTILLNLNNAVISDFESFKQELAAFPTLVKVELKGSNLNNLQMEELTLLYPNTKFVWNIKLGNYWTIATDQVAFSCNKGGGPSLTNADVAQLKYCTDMVALDVGHNSISDISFVRYMPNLRVLIISDNRVADLTPLNTCKNLIYFEAWFNLLSDLSPLQYLVNLKDINVAHNRRCSNITPLLHLPRLERIYMSYCNVPQSSIDLLRSTFPNATIEMVEYYADRAGWRKVNRYYEMRKMYKGNYVSDAFKDDYDKLGYFQKVFDVNYYAAQYPEVVAKVGTDPEDLLYYFLNTGIYEFQVANPEFDVVEYAGMHPELREIYGVDAGAYLRNYLYSE